MRTQGVLIGHRDPVTGLRDVWELDCSLSLQQNIELRYQHGLDHEMVTLSINGEIVNPLKCAELDRKATTFDHVDLVFRQQGVDPITAAIIIAVVLVTAAVAVTLLMPKPQIPNDIGSRKNSSNNSLSGQTNIARAYQAIPDIYGKVRSYPDLIQASLEEYISNVKYITEWMCIGIGEYLVEKQKFADTPLENIPGSSSQVYGPNSVIPEIFEPFRSQEVNGQELLGVNEPDGGDFIGPFFSEVEIDRIWFSLVWPRGLKQTAQFTADWWAVDQNGQQVPGTYEFDQFEYTFNSFDSRYRTRKYSPSAGRSRYAFRIRRRNSVSSSADTPSLSKLESLFFVRRKTNVNFGNVTVYKVQTSATEQATGIRDRIFNAEVTRKTITKSSDTLTENRSFANAVLHEFEVVAGRSRDELDLDSLYAISDNLNDERLGYFDFTFDDKDISLGQRIQTMCNAARVAVYRDGQLWRFVRDEAKPFPTMQLDRRTLKEGSDYQVQIKGHLPSSYDGVKLEYVDPVKNKKAYIQLKIDSVTSQIVEGTSIRPYEIQLAGCRDPFQAMNRAQLEARKIIYQRTTVRDTVLGDPYNQATFGSMIKWVDSYDVAVNDGEILGAEVIPGGYRFLTSEPVTFEDGKSYRVTVTDESGQVSAPSVCTPRPDNKFGFDANIATWYIADDGIKQLGSRYLVTTEEEQEAANFLVSGRSPNQEGDVQIELVEYDDRMYEYDELSQPAVGFLLLENGGNLLKEDSNRLEI